jgi:hypothetical protein
MTLNDDEVRKKLDEIRAYLDETMKLTRNRDKYLLEDIDKLRVRFSE